MGRPCGFPRILGSGSEPGSDMSVGLTSWVRSTWGQPVLIVWGQQGVDQGVSHEFRFPHKGDTVIT